jgi:hypothetical protein
MLMIWCFICAHRTEPAYVAQTFRFKTRVQRLNSMEASARANINFLEQLYIFHRQQEHGGIRITIPTVNHRPVDLWRLKKEVNQLGGYNQARLQLFHCRLRRQLMFCCSVGLSLSQVVSRCQASRVRSQVESGGFVSNQDGIQQNYPTF